MRSSATARRRYDWNDYRSWPDDQRWEIIGGEAFAMGPAPQPRHQLIAGEIFAALHTHLSGKPCKAIMAPVDVRLSAEDIVQPDVVVVCRPDQIKCSAEEVGMDSHILSHECPEPLHQRPAKGDAPTDPRSDVEPGPPCPDSAV